MPENLGAQAPAKLLAAKKNDIRACCRDNEPPVTANLRRGTLHFLNPSTSAIDRQPHTLSSRAKSRDLAFADANHPASRHSHKTQVTPMPTPAKPQPQRGERKQPRTKSRTPVRTQSWVTPEKRPRPRREPQRANSYALIAHARVVATEPVEV
jgi:hypothetical protein